MPYEAKLRNQIRVRTYETAYLGAHPKREYLNIPYPTSKPRGTFRTGSGTHPAERVDQHEGQPLAVQERFAVPLSQCRDRAGRRMGRSNALFVALRPQ